MTFKSTNRDPYNIWRAKNLHRLVDAGVPERIANDNRQFWLLVQEGEEIGYEGWKVDWIDDDQALLLHDLLTQFFGNESSGWGLIYWLRRKLEHDQSDTWSAAGHRQTAPRRQVCTQARDQNPPGAHRRHAANRRCQLRG